MSKHKNKYMMKNHYNSNSKTENFSTPCLPIIPTTTMPTIYATNRIQQGMSVHDLHKTSDNKRVLKVRFEK